MRTVDDRFYSRVRYAFGCWEWTGSKYADGYGRFYWNSRDMVAHRYSYISINGHIPEGLELDHLCRNNSCVNPLHLEAVSHRENVLRSAGAAAVHAIKTSCKRGHLFDGENTAVQRGVYGMTRYCRECRRIQRRANGVAK